MAKRKSLKRARLALFTAAFVICGIPPTTIGRIKLAQKAEAESDVTLSGEGTVENPYLIGTKAELQTFRDITVGENGQTRNSSASARLIANIDLGGSSDNPWNQIGTYSIPYSGTFDGSGYKVSGVYINKPSNSYIGFFTLITNATIKNLTIAGQITGSRDVGGLVAGMGSYSTGNNLIYNCTNECNVTSAYTSTASNGNDSGGLVGYVNGNGNVIRSCVNRGNVTTANVGVYSHVGGIVGYSMKPVTIRNCVNYGNVTAQEYTAGIAGYISSSSGKTVISGCYNKGIITSNGDGIATTGGIVGHIYASNSDRALVEYCGNDGKIITKGGTNGGIAGSITYGKVFACYNTATIEGKTANGLISGGSRLEISNCYNTGTTSATDPKTDVSAGINSSSGSANYPLNIHHVFNTGSITNKDGSTYPYTRRGSIAADPREGVVTNAYYLKGSYKQGIGYYDTPSTTATATELTAEQMKMESSFVGFDFENIWYMGPNHPLLRHSHDFAVTADQSTHTLNAKCERPFCEEQDVHPLTLIAPTLERERGQGSAEATIDETQLNAFNAATGLNVSKDNITYEKIENNQVTSLGTTAPTTFGEYRVKLTVGSEFVSYNYAIAKLEVSFDKKVTLDDQTSETTVSNLNGETATALLTDEEIQDYINGASVSINLKVTTEDNNLKIPALDKNVSKTFLAENGLKEGAFLDLSLYKTVQKKDEQTAEPVAIHESANAFNITLDIPEDIVNAPFGATRTFKIVRIHNGVAETLESTVSDGKISFSTDKFSTYVIVYSDQYQAGGEYIEFTPTIDGANPDCPPYTDYIDNSSVGKTYTVNYKITHNDGFNSILLLPQYDSNVFDIKSITVNNSALGAATISEGSGTKKILLENTGDKYTGLDGENESFLTIVYELKTATPGDYHFGFDLNTTGDNNCSAAYYIVNGEQKGEQTRVPLVVNEPILTLVTVQDSHIVIGRNTAADNPVSYEFTYSKTETGVQLVSDFTPNSNKVEYTYDGDATPVIKWYEANVTDPSNPVRTETVLGSAPMLAGYYYIGISAPESVAYRAAAEVFALVHISPLAVDVTIDNKQSEYKEDLEELTYNTSVQPFEGDDFGIVLSTDATNTSPVGDYSITGSTNGTVGSYVFNFTQDAKYTINPKQVTVIALDQQAEYTGSEPTVDQTQYEIEGVDYELTLQVVITKAPGVNVGPYTLTPSLSETPANYDFTFENGTFSIVSQSKDTAYFEPFFSGKTLTYNGAEQDLLELVEAKDEWWTYTASGNLQKDAKESYTIEITINLTQEDADNHTGGQTMLYFTKTGKINPAPITIKADDKTSEYGNNPEALSGSVVSGTNYNNELTISTSTASPITASTDVGEYEITVSVSSNTNYVVTLQSGTYEVTKGQAEVTASATDVYYNRSLAAAASGNVNTIDLSSLVDIKYYSDSACTQEVTPTDAGTYYVKAIIAGTDNYYGTEEIVEFKILKVKLEDVTFSYSHGQASWTAVANDTGKTSDEAGVAPLALKEGTSVTYYVYDGENLVATIPYNDPLLFNASESTTYKVVAVASNTNYLNSESLMVRAYEVSFNEGNHTGNPTGEVSNMPATQYIFEGQTAIAPDTNPTVDSCTFKYWKVGNDQFDFSTPINGDVVIVAEWDAITYTITLKYVSTSSAENVDLFKIEGLYLNSEVNYSSLAINPTKDSTDLGIYYTFANKWTDTNNVEYNAENSIIKNFKVTGDMTFVAVFNTNYNSFTITYHFSNNESVVDYSQYGDVQTVQYGNEIVYRDYTGANVTWFVTDYWYANEARTEVVPVRMPNHDIDVYGTYKFDIGQGDVNADGSVTTDDITLYRQWVVGGYTMTVVESGNEWDLVNGGNYDANTRYFLKRVADNNQDQSKDIRDISITRMAIVGGYDWDITNGEVVTGDNINKTKTVTTIENVSEGLDTYGRVRLYSDVTSTTTAISSDTSNNIYVDLGGKTLTVKSFSLNTNGINATIYVRNGTIVTTDGITITAPNGNVILENLIGYVGDAEVDLQAASNSLHFAEVVKFYKAENTPAPINVEKDTHLVIEEGTDIVIEKVIVTENFVASESSAIVLDNNTNIDIVVEGGIGNSISTLSELVAAASNGGTYVLTADISYNGTLGIYKDTTIILNGHKLESVNSSALYAMEGATLTINGNGEVKAQEVCVMAFDGSKVVINGGTYTSKDNFVVGTNGSTNRGNNEITINGGTFNGSIQSAGYIACGIYVANNDIVKVNGGTFNVVDGVGILARSGQTYVADGVVFNLTHSDNPRYYGWVGDNKFNIPTLEIVADPAANYPGGTPSVDNHTSYGVWTTASVATEAQFDEAVSRGNSIIYLTSDITYAGQLSVNKDTIIDLRGHTLESTDDCALAVSGGATLTINGEGNVKAQEACVLVVDGSKVVINDGTYTAKDNFVVGTNGTSGRGNNEIAINGGTFNGGIQSAGYVACGIYVANNDTVVVNGGTFNITNGVGILARSGNTTINQGATFNVTGNGTLGKVGDSKVTVPSGRDVVVDYAANYPGGDPVLNNNTDYSVYTLNEVATLDDLVAAASNGGYYALTANISYNGTLGISKDTTIFLNGYTIESGNGSALAASNGATLTINGNGNVKAQEVCVLVLDGSKAVINGGTYTSKDNFVVGTNGSTNRGNNEITINGGTFNGNIVTAGYVACGIYVANSDTVVVNGGTFNIANGVGILARSGNTTVNSGATFNVTGDGTLGKVGDSRVVLPAGEILVIDYAANYPGGTPVLNNNSQYNVYTINA